MLISQREIGILPPMLTVQSLEHLGTRFSIAQEKIVILGLLLECHFDKLEALLRL